MKVDLPIFIPGLCSLSTLSPEPLILWTLVWAVFNWFKKRLLATKAGQMGLLFLSQESSSGCYCSCLAAVMVPTALIIKPDSHQTFLVQSGIFNIFGFYEFTERRWLNQCLSIHEWWPCLHVLNWCGPRKILFDTWPSYWCPSCVYIGLYVVYCTVMQCTAC